MQQNQWILRETAVPSDPEAAFRRKAVGKHIKDFIAHQPKHDELVRLQQIERGIFGT